MAHNAPQGVQFTGGERPGICMSDMIESARNNLQFAGAQFTGGERPGICMSDMIESARNNLQFEGGAWHPDKQNKCRSCI